MQYAAAAFMAGIYLYNIPVAFAFIWKKHRYAAGLGVFYGRQAMRRAEKQLGRPKPRKKVKIKSAKRAALLAARLLRALNVEYFSARLLVGAGDAAATAKLCGSLIALGNVLRMNANGGSVDIRPDFSGKTFEGEVRGVITLRAGDAAKAAARYALGI